jgi:hypothetical protein
MVVEDLILAWEKPVGVAPDNPANPASWQRKAEAL